VNEIIKKRIYIGMVSAVIIAFNLIVYFLVYNKDIRFWNSYIFSMIALIILAVTTYFTMDKMDMRSRFFDMPIVFIVWPYAIIQLIICFFELFIDVIHYPFFLALNSVILLIVMFGLVVKDKDPQVLSLDGNKLKSELFIYNIHLIVENMTDTVSDENTKIYLNQLLDTIAHSDAFSDVSLIEIENEIKTKIQYLKDSIHSHRNLSELFEELQILLAKRNRKCRLLK